MLTATAYDTIVEIVVSHPEFNTDNEYLKSVVKASDRHFDFDKKVWVIKNPHQYSLDIPCIGRALQDRHKQLSLF